MYANTINAVREQRHMIQHCHRLYYTTWPVLNNYYFSVLPFHLSVIYWMVPTYMTKNPILEMISTWNSFLGTAIYNITFCQWNAWCFRIRFWTVRLYWDRGQPGLIMRWILWKIMPLVQDRSLDLLISTTSCYHLNAAPLLYVLWGLIH